MISCGAALPGYSPAATQSPSTTPIDSMIGARDGDGGRVKGFVDGAPCRPRPDGSVNITSHVALDSCASPHATVRPQFDVLSTSAVGSRSLASWPPDLGSFDWLIEPCTPTPATSATSETMVG